MIELAEQFQELRPYLRRVAYSHLGSMTEADDVVQDAWLRLERTDASEIRDLRAWLTTVVSRLALDVLTSARAQREKYVGPWLPEPVVESGEDLDESVSMALLIVLESLSPAERSAFLLHDVFGYSFEEVAGIMDRSPEAARQLASRGRKAVESRRPRYPADQAQQRAAVEAFLAAAREGDIAKLLEILDPDVVVTGDGGGLVPAVREVIGAGRVVEMFKGFLRRFPDFSGRVVDVNGSPGAVTVANGDVSVMSFTLDGGRITAIDVVRNPEKLPSAVRGPAARPTRSERRP
jgi:RNA polymerase sigma-70 factor, ECF subfamily